MRARVRVRVRVRMGVGVRVRVRARVSLHLSEQHDSRPVTRRHDQRDVDAEERGAAGQVEGAKPEQAAAVRGAAGEDRLLHVEQQRFGCRDAPIAEERCDARKPDRRRHDEENELHDRNEVVRAVEHVPLEQRHRQRRADLLSAEAQPC